MLTIYSLLNAFMIYVAAVFTLKGMASVCVSLLLPSPIVNLSWSVVWYNDKRRETWSGVWVVNPPYCKIVLGR